MTGLVGALSALGELIPIFWKLYALYKEAKVKGWIEDGRSLHTKLLEADSNEKRMAIAKSLWSHRAQ